MKSRIFQRQARPVPQCCSLFFALIFFLFAFGLNCERSTDALTATRLSLSLEYAGVTDAQLRLQTEHAPQDASFQLLRGDSAIYSGTLSDDDTSFYDEGLLPARQYVYRAQLLKAGRPVAQSPPLTVQTMDTTSHDFQWEMIEIPSPYGSGALYDIALVSEFEAWAVGEIYADSAKPLLPYNAVHITIDPGGGVQWELRRINFYLCPNGTTPTPYPIKSVYAFSSDDVWFTKRGSIVHWNGQEIKHDCQINSVIEGSINKLWGIDSNNLYAVGHTGTIVHYNGSSWQKLETGTSDIINDIYGNSNTDKHQILCAAGDVYSAPNGQILSINPDLTVTHFPWPVNIKIHSIWMKNKFVTFACGAGIWRYFGSNWQKYEGVTGAFWRRIRGNAINDIFTCGDFGYVSHFNGQTWKSYQFNQINLPISLDVKEDLVVIVSYDRANIIVGRRNK